MTSTTTMTSEHKLDDVKFIMTYCLGGNSVFTLVSPKTGRRFTYKMIKSRTADNQYEVRLLQGDDNTKDFHHVGRFYDVVPNQINVPSLYLSKSCRWLEADKDWWQGELRYEYSNAAIAWLLLKTQKYLIKGGEFWTSGRCAKCGRLLTDPESIASGFGLSM